MALELFSGICDRLREYNRFSKREYVVIIKDDTACELKNATGGMDISFGNPYQLIEWLDKNTGIQQ